MNILEFFESYLGASAVLHDDGEIEVTFFTHEESVNFRCKLKPSNSPDENLRILNSAYEKATNFISTQFEVE